MAGSTETINGQESTPGQQPVTTNQESTIIDDEHVDIPPPPYSSSTEVLLSDCNEPPAYNEVVKLPTYREVEDIHRENAIRNMFGLSSSDSELHYPPDLHETDEDIKIGSDFGFMACFLLSFLLNWIGFLAGYCFSSSLACQYGALSGFGLSLVKWGFLIKHSNCCSDMLGDKVWLIWVFVILGWLIFLRGAMAYVQLKRSVRGQGSFRLWSR